MDTEFPRNFKIMDGHFHKSGSMNICYSPTGCGPGIDYGLYESDEASGASDGLDSSPGLPPSPFMRPGNP